MQTFLAIFLSICNIIDLYQYKKPLKACSYYNYASLYFFYHSSDILPTPLSLSFFTPGFPANLKEPTPLTVAFSVSVA